MSTGRVGVAISTTGDEHRMPFLETCVQHWRNALPLGSTIVVTVDGSADDLRRACKVVDTYTTGLCGGTTYRVGVPLSDPAGIPHEMRYSAGGRMGVAANKNTGIELLMDAQVDHLFLSDDDTWPLYPQSLTKHIDLGIAHSMVCWGKHRLDKIAYGLASWSWPRGAVLYATRHAVLTVGGMDERFGPGGHEHVEWSNRIHNAGLTPFPYSSPGSYATREGMGARALWHAEDMPRVGEKLGDHRLRRRNLTSVQRTAEDWTHINEVMASREGDASYVGFRAHENGRASATLCQNQPSQGDCAVEPAKPRSQT